MPSVQLSAFPELERFHGARIYCGDAVQILQKLPARSVDAVISDVPYGLSELSEGEIREALSSWLAGKPHTPWSKGGIIGASWDAFCPGPELWREVARVAKPGARILTFGSPRTADLISIAMRLGGLEVFDMIAWLYGQGGVRGLDVAKAIDKQRGVHRGKGEAISVNGSLENPNYDNAPKGRAISETARRFEGWTTTLRTAMEPIIAARVPLEDGPLVTMQRYGTGAWNIEAGRIRTPAHVLGKRFGAGRFPSNAVHDGSAEILAQLQAKPPRKATLGGRHAKTGSEHDATPDRYFYCAKPNAQERKQSGGHETLKPITLLRWLVRLSTPPGGVVLDCTAGSGTTNAAALEEGFATIAIERDKARIPAMKSRLEEVAKRKKVSVEVL